jgi:hypothetical protein
VIGVRDIEMMRERVGAAEGVGEALAAGWDAFELVQAVASQSADLAPDMFPAFMFAAASAAEGRDAVGFAPSMPASLGEPARLTGPESADAHQVADELADLVTALGVRLHAAAHHAVDPGDRHACAHAASEADRIRHLLGPDR